MEVIGREERSWFSRDWAPSRAVDLRRSSGLVEELGVVERSRVVGAKGFGSMARR